MRLEYSARNTMVAWSGQALYVLCNFITRAVFVTVLAKEYLGLENLFASVLTILSLAELGVGSAIIFCLYRPLAEDDREKVKSLMRLFKRAYIAIGITVAVVGAALTPFVSELIVDAPDIPNLQLYFFCFVLNSSVSYFFSYKGSLIAADQKKYIVSLIQYGFQIVMSIAQIVVLLTTGNYLLFLVCMVASTLLQNIVIALTANRMYPYLRERDVAPIDAETMSGIKKNMFGLLLHRLAGVSNVPLSSLVISQFVSLGAVAVYGNYILVTNALTRVLDQAFDAVTASVGNLGVTEDADRQYEVFSTAFFINAFVYAVVSITLLCAFNPFIELWLGTDYLFPIPLVVLVVALFYIRGMRSAEQSFTNAYGLFWVTRYKAVLETVVLIILTVVMCYFWGIAGALAANIVSMVCVSTTIEVYLLYKHGFRRPSKPYFIRWVGYVALTVLLAGCAYALCMPVPGTGVVALLVKIVIGAGVPAIAFVVIFHGRPEYRRTMDMAHRLRRGLRSRLARRSGEGDDER